MPQKFHLRTKESYKCPIKGCESFICKPTMRGRTASYEVRTAVMDILPKITIELKSGNLMPNQETVYELRIQNRHTYNLVFSFDHRLNSFQFVCAVCFCWLGFCVCMAVFNFATQNRSFFEGKTHA